jgi:hypothetical protein
MVIWAFTLREVQGDYSVVRVRTKHFSNIALVLGYNFGSWGHEPRRDGMITYAPTFICPFATLSFHESTIICL